MMPIQLRSMRLDLSSLCDNFLSLGSKILLFSALLTHIALGIVLPPLLGAIALKVLKKNMRENKSYELLMSPRHL